MIKNSNGNKCHRREVEKNLISLHLLVVCNERWTSKAVKILYLLISKKNGDLSWGKLSNFLCC
jgi:hypothetical protein